MVEQTPVGPEISQIIEVSLCDVEGPFVDLSKKQQKKQSGDIFEVFGMHWMLAIETEKKPSGQKPRDINIVLFNLSSKITAPERRKTFPLDGVWDVPHSSDDKPRFFNGREGDVCNLIGESFPADAVKFDSFKLSLHSGPVKQTFIVQSTMKDSQNDDWGGYYDESWYGVGQLMLENFKGNPVHDARAVEITLQFWNKAPEPMISLHKHRSVAATATEEAASESPSNSHGNKKRKATRKATVKTEG